MRLTIVLLILGVLGQDACLQYTSFRSCIQVEQLQCHWSQEVGKCMFTNDFLKGCLITLSQLACIKQLSSPNLKLAGCKFTNQCESVVDFTTERCSSSLSKYGCLAITNPQELCEWKEYKCHKLAQNEQHALYFSTKLYSASVCPLIENYLIMHSSILWPVINYTPDLIQQSELQMKADLGIAEIQNKTYSDPTTVKLRNNYVDSLNMFTWYTLRQTSAALTSNLQIADRTREGCIAVEILNDADFLNIITKSISKGVNHVYCKYLIQVNVKGNNKQQLAIFVNNGCHIITNIQTLQDQAYIDKYSITCYSMDYTMCGLLNNRRQKCTLLTNNANSIRNEYSCINENSVPPSTLCNAITNYELQDSCKKAQFCYLDTSATIPSCSNACYQIKNKNDCTSGYCTWSSQYQNSIDHTGISYQLCLPNLRCLTPGLSKDYCQIMAELCAWDQKLNECVNAGNLNKMKCSEASTTYTCSQILTSDQYCLWHQDNICINILENPLLMDYASLSQDYIVNLNLCLSYKSGLYQYNNLTTQCKQVPAQVANNWCAMGISKNFCLNLNVNCEWNELISACVSGSSQIKLCEEIVNVSPSACKYGTVNNGQKCIHKSSTYSCYQIPQDQLTCSSQGISKNDCLTVSKPGEYCRWSDNQCNTINIVQLKTQICDSIVDVNKQTCVAYNNGQVQCKFDPSKFACYTPNVASTDCSELQNAAACSTSTSSCYFTNMQCQAVIDYNTLQCEGWFASKSACLQISQSACYWNTTTNQCTNAIIDSHLECNSTVINQKACLQIKVPKSTLISINYVCIYDQNVCKTQAIDINGCGNISMNIHSCVGYAQGNCYYDNSQCLEIDPTSTHGRTKLNSISCEQANQQICRLVTTPGQICKVFKNDFSTLYKDYKCSQQIDQISSTSCQTIFQQAQHNGNICSTASDSCYFDNLSCSVLNKFLVCTAIGLSSKACIQMTIGRCTFVDQLCRQLTPKDVNCSNRNQLACIQSGNTLCQFDSASSVCTSYSNICQTTEAVGKIYSFSVCSKSTTNCYWKAKYCEDKAITNVSCDMPGINSTLCNSSTQACQFIDLKCIPVVNRTCEDCQTQQECVNNITPNQFCIYVAGRCWNSPKADSCLDYTITNYNFCSQFTDCYYKNNTCNKQSYLSQLASSCDQIKDAFGCFLHKSLLCIWNSNSCNNAITTQCPHLNQLNVSKMVCNKYPQCNFQSTVDGSFCYDRPIRCEDMSQSICLLNISSSYKCYFDVTCKTSVFTNCSQAVGILMNQSACDALSGCKYSREYNTCKQQIIPSTGECSDAKDQYTCIYFFKFTCYWNFTFCTNSGTEDNLNVYGCSQVTSQPKVYNFWTNQCVPYVNIDSLIRTDDCGYLNQSTCIKYSDLVGLKCRWSTTCLNILPSEFPTIACDGLNKLACLSMERSDLVCHWDANVEECKVVTMSSHGCNISDVDSASRTYSLNVCSSATQSCIIKQDRTNCETLTQQFSFCEGYGLSKTACLTLTASTTCVWKSNCMTANLYNTLCSDDVSQTTCLQIKTYKEVCEWKDNACSKVIQLGDQQCQTAMTLEQCKQIPTQQCIFTTKCQVLVEKESKCLSNLNIISCRNVVGEVCQWINNTCKIAISLSKADDYACEIIHNKNACLKNIRVCQWSLNICKTYSLPSKVVCKFIEEGVNAFGCNQLALDPCTFDWNTLKCTTKVDLGESGMTLKLSHSASYSKSFLNDGKCSDQLNLYDCTQVVNFPCIWTTSCITFTDFNQNCSTSMSKLACVRTTKQMCAWRSQKCLVVNDINLINTVSDISNVNVKVCEATIDKFFIDNGCYKTPIEGLTCTSPGLSIGICLSLKQSCQYIYGKCTIMVGSYQSCDQYVNVTEQVCRTLVDLKCQYNNKNSCMNADLNVYSTSYSKLACLFHTATPVYWDDSLGCQKINGQIACDQPILTNSLACATVINKECVYDSEILGCSSTYNKNSMLCSGGGVNILACAQLTTQPCIFSNGSCKKFNNPTTSCMNVQNVNAMSCATILNQLCLYDIPNRSCIEGTKQLPCNTSGLNKVGCLSNQACHWSNDFTTCECQTTTDFCSNVRGQECVQNPDCYFENDNCVIKRCEHITDPLACRSTRARKYCYLDKYDKCYSALFCDDVINVTEKICSKLVINGVTCAYVGNKCANPDNYSAICPYDKLCQHDKCIFDQVCRERRCSDTKCESERSTCYISPNGTCQPLTSCNQITDPNQCAQKIVDGLKCNYQRYSLFKTKLICTSQPCSMFDGSRTLCHGNESNNYSCVLNQQNQCITCENITDKCSCPLNVCAFKNNQCQSVLCSSYNQTNCNLQAFCLWNKEVNECLRKCNKLINADECNARTGQCYYDQLEQACKAGVPVIPDLNIEIERIVSYTAMLTLVILIY